MSEYRLENAFPKIDRKQGVTIIEYKLAKNKIIHTQIRIEEEN